MFLQCIESVLCDYIKRINFHYQNLFQTRTKTLIQHNLNKDQQLIS